MKNNKGAKRAVSFVLALILTMGLICQNQSAFFMANEVPEESDLEMEQLDLSEYLIQEGGFPHAEMTVFGFEPRESNKAGAVEALKGAISSLQPSVDLSAYQISASQLINVYTDALNYNPELFYASNKVEWYKDDDGMVTECLLYYKEDYLDDLEGYKAEYNAALDAAYDEAITDPNMSTVQKALAFHDYLAQHMQYDTNYEKRDAYTALVEGVSVCQGYTLAYTALLNKAGIQNDYCESDDMNHIWNYVKIGEEWYHVDVTWDDPVPDKVGRVSHQFFLISDEKIKIEESGGQVHHDWTKTQDCSDTIYDDYYWRNDLSAIFYIDGSNYYIKSTNDSGSSLGLYRRTAGSETKLIDISDTWYAWGNTSSYWTGNYSRLSYCGGKLYYNGTKDIYEVVPSTGAKTKIYTYPGTDGYLYGLLACGSEITLGIAQSPKEAQTRTKIDIPGEPIKSLSVTASTAQLTYGYTSGAVLSANLVKGSGVTGTPTYQWYTVSTNASGVETESLILGQTGATYTLDTGLAAGSYKYRVKATLNGKSKTADVTVTVKKQSGTISK